MLAVIRDDKTVVIQVVCDIEVNDLYPGRRLSAARIKSADRNYLDDNALVDASRIDV